MLWHKRDREENCGEKKKTECVQLAAKQTSHKIHVSRRQDWRRMLLTGKEFSPSRIPNSQFAGPDLILKSCATRSLQSCSSIGGSEAVSRRTRSCFFASVIFTSCFLKTQRRRRAC